MSGKSPFRQLFSRYRQGLLTLVLLFTSSVLILFNGTPGVQQPQEIGLTIISSVEEGVSSVLNIFSHGFQGFFDLLDIQKKYETAMDKLKAVSGVDREIIHLKEENLRLKKLLDFEQSLPYQTIPAEVVAKDPTKIYASFTINKGYLDGIRKNEPVVCSQNEISALVGKISEVGLSTAVVQPILDGNMYVAARFQNNRFEGLVSGKGNNEELLKMTYVDKTAKSSIQFGDLVVTSGLDSLYPSGILIGRVKAINSQEYETSLTVEIEPLIAFSKIEDVLVLKVNP
jgi:rod shape-determining protein MreC